MRSTRSAMRSDRCHAAKLATARTPIRTNTGNINNESRRRFDCGGTLELRRRMEAVRKEDGFSSHLPHCIKSISGVVSEWQPRLLITAKIAACYRDSNTFFSLAVMVVGPKQFMGPTQ